MLDRLMRGLVGRKPVEFGRRIVSMVAGPALTPLAARVLDHYRKTPPPLAEFQVEARAFTEELLQNIDPADLVASLVISLPAITVEPIVEGARSFQVQNGYRSIISHGLPGSRKCPFRTGAFRPSRSWRRSIPMNGSCSSIRTMACKAAFSWQES